MTARTSGRPIEKSGILQTQVYLEECKAWGTPRLSTANAHLKTLHAEVVLGSQHPLGPQDEDSTNTLGNLQESSSAGHLNPRWVETLMGLPLGWVMPSCDAPIHTLKVPDGDPNE